MLIKTFGLGKRDGSYEFIGVFVDDITVFSKNPHDIFKTLSSKYKYEFKEIEVPKYYNGADIEYEEEDKCYSISGKTYIKKHLWEDRDSIGDYFEEF